MEDTDDLESASQLNNSSWQLNSSTSSSIPSGQPPGYIDPRFVQSLTDMIGRPTQLGFFIGTSMSLNQEHQGDIALLSQFVHDSNSMLTVYSIVAQFRTQEMLQGLGEMQQSLDEVFDDYRASKAAEKAGKIVLSVTEKSSIAIACKVIVYEKDRTLFENQLLVDAVYAHLKHYHRTNAFTSHFKNKEPELFTRVMRSYISKEASEAKSKLRNLYIDTKTVGASEAASTIAKGMTGNSDHSLPELLRVLLIRQFVREHSWLFETAKEKKSLKRKKGSSRHHNAVAVSESQSESQCDNPVDVDGSTWAVFQIWIQKNTKEWGESFDSEDWKSFFNTCEKVERTRHPNDTLVKIPRKNQILQSGGPQPGSFVGLASSIRLSASLSSGITNDSSPSPPVRFATPVCQPQTSPLRSSVLENNGIQSSLQSDLDFRRLSFTGPQVAEPTRLSRASSPNPAPFRFNTSVTSPMVPASTGSSYPGPRGMSSLLN